jgi:hypothetical protein
VAYHMSDHNDNQFVLVTLRKALEKGGRHWNHPSQRHWVPVHVLWLPPHTGQIQHSAPCEEFFNLYSVHAVPGYWVEILWSTLSFWIIKCTKRSLRSMFHSVPTKKEW